MQTEPLAGASNTGTGIHNHINANTTDTGLYSQNGANVSHGTNAAMDPNVQGYTSGTGPIPPALENARFGHGVEHAPGHNSGVAGQNSNLAGLASHNANGGTSVSHDGALNPTNHTTASNTSLTSQTPVDPHIHTVEPFHHTGAAIPVEATDANPVISHGHPDKHDAHGTAVPSAAHEGRGVTAAHPGAQTGADGQHAKPSKVAEIAAKVEIAVGGLLHKPALKAKGEEKLAEVEAARVGHTGGSGHEHHERDGYNHGTNASTGAPHTHAHGGANIEQVGGFAGNVPMTTGAVPGHANAGLF